MKFSPAVSLIRLTATRWALLATIVLGSLFFGTLLYALSAKGPSKEQEARDSLDAIAQSILNDYTIPIASAGAQLDVICQHTVPDPAKNRQCGEFVQVLRTRTVLLEDDIRDLRALRTEGTGTDIFVGEDGRLYEKPQDGSGPGDFTGLKLKDGKFYFETDIGDIEIPGQ